MNNVKKGARIKIKNYIFSAMFIVSLILLMIAVSFSWFNNGKSASISGITVSTVEANNLLVNGVKEVELEVPEDFKFLAVTGDGNQFYTPMLELGTLQGAPDTLDYHATGYSLINQNQYTASGIYQAEFSFLVENDKQLSLTSESYVSASEESPRSAYGEYSAGNICGAVRVAFFAKGEQGYELKCIWIPNSTVHLDASGDTAILPPEQAEVEKEYVFYHNGSKQPTRIQTDGQPNGEIGVDGVKYVWGDLSSGLVLSDIKGDTDLQIKMIVWVDGTDREAHNALMDGTVTMNFVFNVS